MTNRKKLLPLLIVALVGIGAAVYYYVTDKKASADFVEVSGNIEVIDVDLSFKIPGRVQQRLVTEGESVKAGQVIARLDTEDLEADLHVRQAEVKASQAALAELEAGSRPEEIAGAEAVARKAQSQLEELLAGSRPQEIAAAEATVTAAKVEVDRLKLDYDRITALRERAVATAQEYDMAKAAYDSGVAKLQEAQEKLKLVKEGPRTEEIEQARQAAKDTQEKLAMIRKGPRVEVIDQARAKLDQAKQSLNVAQVKLNYATITSPITGVVLSKNVEAGEYVAAGTPILTVADIGHVFLRAYIDETDTGKVKLGQRVDVTTDTFPHKVYTGRIGFISKQAEFTPRNVQTKKERVKLVYRVKVNIENPQMELKPGMPADGRILTNSGFTTEHAESTESTI